MRRHISIMFGQGLAIALMVGFMIGFSPAVFTLNCAFAEVTDDFNDNSKDPAKWGADEWKGQGQLNEINGRLEYTTSGNGTLKDSMDRKWIFTEFPYDSDWSIEITVTNSSAFSDSNMWSSFGINVRSKKDPEDEIEIELAAQAFGARLFWSEFLNNGDFVSYAMQSTTLTVAPIRLFFYSAWKVFYVYGNDGGWNSFG